MQVYNPWNYRVYAVCMCFTSSRYFCMRVLLYTIRVFCIFKYNPIPLYTIYIDCIMYTYIHGIILLPSRFGSVLILCTIVYTHTHIHGSKSIPSGSVSIYHITRFLLLHLFVHITISYGIIYHIPIRCISLYDMVFNTTSYRHHYIDIGSYILYHIVIYIIYIICLYNLVY